MGTETRSVGFSATESFNGDADSVYSGGTPTSPAPSSITSSPLSQRKFKRLPISNSICSRIWGAVCSAFQKFANFVAFFSHIYGKTKIGKPVKLWSPVRPEVIQEQRRKKIAEARIMLNSIQDKIRKNLITKGIVPRFISDLILYKLKQMRIWDLPPFLHSKFVELFSKEGIDERLDRITETVKKTAQKIDPKSVRLVQEYILPTSQNLTALHVAEEALYRIPLDVVDSNPVISDAGTQQRTQETSSLVEILIIDKLSQLWKANKNESDEVFEYAYVLTGITNIDDVEEWVAFTSKYLPSHRAEFKAWKVQYEDAMAGKIAVFETSEAFKNRIKNQAPGSA